MKSIKALPPQVEASVGPVGTPTKQSQFAAFDILVGIDSFIQQENLLIPLRLRGVYGIR